MATVPITINLPSEHAEVIIETFARARGWRSEQQDGPVGAFAGNQLIESIMNTLRDKRGDDAADIARQEAIDIVNNNVVITIGNGQAR